MRITVIVLFVLIILSVLVQPAASQQPYLRIYFDSGLTSFSSECPPEPPGMVLDSLFIVAFNLNAFISAIEFGIDYTSNLMWLADDHTGLSIGNSDTGIAIAWPFPQNAFTPLLVDKVYFLWMCQNCSCGLNVCVCPQVHPETGRLRAVRWPDNEFIYMNVLPGVLCAAPNGDPCRCEQPVPVEETSWGKIKALYSR